MIYPSYSVLAVAAILSLQAVFAAPMPMEAKIGDGNTSGNRDTIENTMPVVNQKLKNMKAVINLPDAQARAHPATIKAFGRKANVQQIRKNIDILDASKIMIPTHDANKNLGTGSLGATNMETKHIEFGSNFFTADANTRASTIIHEASHAKLGAVDHFQANGQPGKKGDPIVAYKDSHMNEFIAKHSEQAHHNADSYRVFSEECPHVRRSLYRRAMAEPHPVARSTLLRRAAKACAWKPKAKAAARKEAAKKAPAPISKSSQKSVAAKKPLNGAKNVNKAAAAKLTKPVNIKSTSKVGAKPAAASKKVVSKPAQHSTKKTTVKTSNAKPAKAAAKPVQHPAKKPAVKTPKANTVQHSAKKPIAKTPKAAPAKAVAKAPIAKSLKAAPKPVLVKATAKAPKPAPAKPVAKGKKN